MRDIKFRAWDSQVKKMWNWEEIKEYRLSALEMKPGVAYLFLQYTGFKDMNDTDIYEHDFLTYPCDEHGSHIFDIGEFPDLMDDDICSREFTLDKDTMIIGNKYENPELLT